MFKIIRGVEDEEPDIAIDSSRWLAMMSTELGHSFELFKSGHHNYDLS